MRKSFLWLALALPLAGRPAQCETIQSADGFVTLEGIAKLTDSISPAQLAHVRSAISAYEKRQAALGSRTKAGGPFLYPFFPQSGIQGQDLFTSKFTDLSPRPGPILDWDCSEYTYDGHTGHDSVIRSFREQEIGVPVFAVLPGTVVETHDGEPDRNTVWDFNNQANYVVIDHGSGYYAWYFHFRKGSVAVSPGQTVTAGTQIGLTGSSGISGWPHLHFETEKDGQWVEPSAGPCNQGDSLWVSQPTVHRDFVAVGFYMAHSPVPVQEREVWALDATERTGTFVTGLQTVGLRIDVHNLPASPSYDFRLLNPSGEVAADIRGAFATFDLYDLTVITPSFNINLDRVGTWRFQSVVAGSLIVDAPFKVVATPQQAVNRPPNKIKARLSPTVDGQAVICAVQSDLLIRDPDFDIVSYRYEWKVNGRLVRTVTSAGLTDILAAGKAHVKNKVSCKVTPTDGKKAGAAVTVNGTVVAP